MNAFFPISGCRLYVFRQKCAIRKIPHKILKTIQNCKKYCIVWSIFLIDWLLLVIKYWKSPLQSTTRQCCFPMGNTCSRCSHQRSWNMIMYISVSRYREQYFSMLSWLLPCSDFYLLICWFLLSPGYISEIHKVGQKCYTSVNQTQTFR